MARFDATVLPEGWATLRKTPNGYRRATSVLRTRYPTVLSMLHLAFADPAGTVRATKHLDTLAATFIENNWNACDGEQFRFTYLLQGDALHPFVAPGVPAQVTDAITEAIATRQLTPVPPLMRVAVIRALQPAQETMVWI